MIKKILGVFFILISVIFGLGFLLQIPKVLNAYFSDGFNYSLGYAIGSLLFIVIAYFFFKFGIKLMKNSSKKSDSIEQIGKN